MKLNFLKLTKKNLYVWTCDYSENSGEGKLARLFIKKYNYKKEYNFFFNQNKILKSKYFSAIFGIIFCWNKFLTNKRVIYLNYLPLWNFFLFLFLPPKTILGPITGGANFNNSDKFQYYIRKHIFPIFFKISEKILNFREFELIFSTDLLKKYLSKNTIKKSKFNFVLNYYSINRKKIKKKYDFIIYNRNHKNKKNFFPINLIKKLIMHKFSIIVIGEKLNLRSVKNIGYINNNLINYLQSQSRFTIASGENIYSFFILECLSNDVKILIDTEFKKQINFKKQNFIVKNFKNLKNFLFLKN